MHRDWSSCPTQRELTKKDDFLLALRVRRLTSKSSYQLEKIRRVHRKQTRKWSLNVWDSWYVVCEKWASVHQEDEYIWHIVHSGVLDFKSKASHGGSTPHWTQNMSPLFDATTKNEAQSVPVVSTRWNLNKARSRTVSVYSSGFGLFLLLFSVFPPRQALQSQLFWDPPFHYYANDSIPHYLASW